MPTMAGRLSVLGVAFIAVSLAGCNSALLLGRTGDDLENADTYALCKARRSVFASQAVTDAIRRRQIDCRYWDGQITAEDAARRAAAFDYGASIINKPVVTPPPRATTTNCTKYGNTVNCTTY